jgi:hypothetical protein
MGMTLDAPHTRTRPDAEIVAESVAFIVGPAVGLDTSDYSAGSAHTSPAPYRPAGGLTEPDDCHRGLVPYTTA